MTDNTDKLSVDKWAELDKLTYEWIHKNVDSTLGFINWSAGHKSLTDFVAQLLTKERERMIGRFLEIVGEDDKEVRGTTQNADNPAHHTKKTIHRNQLRHDIKKQLKGLEQ